MLFCLLIFLTLNKVEYKSMDIAYHNLSIKGTLMLYNMKYALEKDYCNSHDKTNVIDEASETQSDSCLNYEAAARISLAKILCTVFH